MSEEKKVPEKKFDKKKWLAKKLEVINGMQNKAKAKALSERLLSK